MADWYSNDAYLESDEFPFAIGRYRIGGGERILPHRHEFVELAYISQGEGLHEYEGEVYPIGAGDVFIIEQGKVHAYVVGEQQFLEVVNVLFVPSLLTKELSALSGVASFVDFYYMEPFLRTDVSFQAKLTLTPRQHMEMVELLERLYREFEHKESGYRFLIKTKLMEMFILLSRMYEAIRQRPLAAIHGDRATIDKLCDFLARHPARSLALEQVCRMAGMSQSKFTALFRSVTGLTYLEYRNGRRIELAKRLLSETEDRILQVGMEVGFEDISHFNRVFKQQTGMSPGQYRKRSRLE